MARQAKRKAAEISAFDPITDKKQEASKAQKKPKLKDTKVSSVESPRATRSTSNQTTASKGSSAKLPSISKAPSKKSLPKITSKVTKKNTETSNQFVGREVDTKASVSIALSPKNAESKSKLKNITDVESEDDTNSDGHQYWLMKAEPESRIEKGKDVKFSIDDLKAATSPEPWDGVRNVEAKNNMRAMNKGDLAFFYHSNCKVPGIVGVMEIVHEHSVDESAFDEEHPYYDEKSSRENPKWHLVHVGFKQKFPEMITLKELQKFSKDGGTLENMQTIRRSRLSVSKVSKKEWDFIMSLVDTDDELPASNPQAKGLKDSKANGVAHTAPESIGQKPVPTEAQTDVIQAEKGDDLLKLHAANAPGSEAPA